MALKGIEILEVVEAEGLDEALGLLRRAVEAQHGPGALARFGEAERLVRGSLGQPGGLLLLARRAKGEAVAVLFAAPSRNPFLGTSVSFLYALYVRPEDRRAGIASALLARAESLARDRGGTALAAEVPYQDDALISLGERRGYVREREWMAKELG